MLETLWGDEPLDFGCFGIWFLAFALWLNFTSNDELADLLNGKCQSCIYTKKKHFKFSAGQLTSSSLLKLKNFRIFVALFGPKRLG
jgi:hypothetical protein